MRWPERYALDPAAGFYAKALTILGSNAFAQIRYPLFLIWRFSNIVL